MTAFSDEPGGGVLARAAALLDAFDDEHRELTLAALVGRSGLPRSAVHRMAAQMVALGWLDKPRGRYRIGNRLFALSGLAPVRHTLREAVLPFLQDLYEATRTTVQLGVLDGDRVLIVEKITGHRRMPMLTQVGGQIPAYCSSLGRCILAHSDAAVVDGVLGGELPARTPRTLTDPDAPTRVRASHWLNPVYPTAYRDITPSSCASWAPQELQRRLQP